MKKSSKVYILIICLMVLAGCGVGIYFAVKNGKKESVETFINNVEVMSIPSLSTPKSIVPRTRTKPTTSTTVDYQGSGLSFTTLATLSSPTSATDDEFKPTSESGNPNDESKSASEKPTERVDLYKPGKKLTEENINSLLKKWEIPKYEILLK